MSQSVPTYSHIMKLSWLVKAAIQVFCATALMMPEEAAQQTRVFMSTASSSVWSTDAQAVQGSLALLANTLVKYQAVAIYASPSDVAYMRSQLNSSVEIIEFQVRRVCLFFQAWWRNRDCTATYFHKLYQPIDLSFTINHSGFRSLLQISCQYKKRLEAILPMNFSNAIFCSLQPGG